MKIWGDFFGRRKRRGLERGVFGEVADGVKRCFKPY
jgi:hypothetical protein